MKKKPPLVERREEYYIFSIFEENQYKVCSFVLMAILFRFTKGFYSWLPGQESKKRWRGLSRMIIARNFNDCYSKLMFGTYKATNTKLSIHDKELGGC